MTIEKLSIREEAPLTDGGALYVIERKLNELIEDYNNHFHETLDTHYYTTSPKQMEDIVSD